MVKVLDVEVGSTGYGLMGFHLPPPTPFETAIPVLHQAYTLGARFWSVAHYYGTRSNNSLHLLHAYFTQYPSHAPDVIISVKIGMDPDTHTYLCDEAGIQKSFEECEAILAGVKKIDILSCARIDPAVGVEVSVGAIDKLVREGKVGGVGVSEVSAKTIQRAAKVAKVVAVEVEFSMFTPAILTNGVAEACAEAGAVVAAYTPLGKGLLTGKIPDLGSLPEGDIRRMFPRFGEEALRQNLKLVEEVEEISKNHQATKGQVALAWIRAYSGQERMPNFLPIPGTTNAGRLEENVTEVKLSEEDVKELDDIVGRNPVVGDRYPGGHMQDVEG